MNWKTAKKIHKEKSEKYPDYLERHNQGNPVLKSKERHERKESKAQEKKEYVAKKISKGKYKGAGDSRYHNKELAEQDKRIHEKYWK